MYDQTIVSPDGRLRIELSYSSGLMSHEIWSPTVYDQQSGEVLLSLGSGWDASFLFNQDGTAQMSLRHYYERRNTILSVCIDAPGERFRIGEGEWYPIARMQEVVPATFRGQPVFYKPPPAPTEPPRPAPPKPVIQEKRPGLVVVLAIVMLGVFGAAAYLTLEVWRLPQAVAFAGTAIIFLAVGYGLFRFINRS